MGTATDKLTYRGWGAGVYFRVHTDIVSHSTDGFPTHTGAEFLEFLRALASSDPANLSGSPLEAFLGSHPAALAFVQTPKPAPVSFATETYFGVTAMRFTNAKGVSRFGRYRIIPRQATHLDDGATKAKSANYLFDEIAERVDRDRYAFRCLCRWPSVRTSTMPPSTARGPGVGGIGQIRAGGSGSGRRA